MALVQPQQRVEAVDVLRGYALMGLFLIHMVEYFELYWHSPEPGPVNTWSFFLFGGKAYAMFALLFGVSFFIIMESQARKGVDFGARFIWRLAVLFLIGFVHAVIYGATSCRFSRSPAGCSCRCIVAAIERFSSLPCSSSCKVPRGSCTSF